MPQSLAASPSWYDQMRALFRNAQFAAAGAIYDAAISRGSRPSASANLLRARIWLKKDENRAVAFLIDRWPKTSDPRGRGEWELLLGVGYARMRDFERADHHLGLAQRAAAKPADRATIAYQLARRYLLEGRLDDAWRSADEMAKDRSANSRVSYELLRSFIFSHEERYREEAQSLIQAIDLIGPRRDDHLEAWFHAVQNLALLGRELSMPAAGALAKTEVDQDVEWPPDFAAQRFQALKAVGWTCALTGDMLGCFRYLRAAEQQASSDAFAAIVLIDRAFFARIVGEVNWANNEISKAETIAERIDWNALAGEERIGLLLLAEAVSNGDPEKARFYFARYNGLQKLRSPLHLFAFDHRIEAFAAYTEGVVRLAAGDAGAEAPLRKAWSIFDRIGYDWRAGRTALRLFELTQKNRWRLLAEDKFESYPQSWLVGDLQRLSTDEAPPITLPPMQQKVLSMLCQKMSTAEIAKVLGLSPYTVRNHLKAVFRSYDVHNRAALVAEVANRGKLPSVTAQNTS